MPRQLTRADAVGLDKRDLQQRVGAFVRARREVLGLSAAELARALGYAFRGVVTDVEQGRRAIPFAGIYAWADALEVARDMLVRFVNGESDVPPSGAPATLSLDETLLVERLRTLPPAEQRAIRDRVEELAARRSARAKRSK